VGDKKGRPASLKTTSSLKKAKTVLLSNKSKTSLLKHYTEMKSYQTNILITIGCYIEEVARIHRRAIQKRSP